MQKKVYLCTKNRQIINYRVVNLMSFSEFWTHIKVRKWGKYVVTCLAFLVVFLFVGDQSLLRSWHRWREIVHLEEQRDMYRQGAEKAQQEMLLLQNPDSLERCRIPTAWSSTRANIIICTRLTRTSSS